MRIVHVISSLHFGGAEQLLYEILRASASSSHEHHVVYLRYGPVVEKIKQLGIATYSISGLVTRYDFLAYYRLKKLIKKLKPDLIHSAHWSANILARFAGRAFRIPVINDLHGSCAHHGHVRNWCDAITAHLAQRFVAVSDGVKSSFITDVLQKKRNQKEIKDLAQRVDVIVNSVDSDIVRKEGVINPLTRADLGLTSQDFVIGSIGRFTSIKSYDLMIRAFSRIRETLKNTNRTPRLLLVGDGPEMPKLQHIVEIRGIKDSVVFTGFREDVRRFYPLFDCFALSSKSEGISIALLEALCFGLPVITTNSTMSHEVITHNKHGLLVPVGDVLRLRDAFTFLIENPQVCHEMGQANCQLVQDRFSMQAMMNHYQKLYHSVASR